MRMYDIIAKKRDGAALSKEEIDFFIKGYTAGDIPDYQAAALAMAIYIHGMSHEETVQLTLSMASSGDMIDLSPLGAFVADKHSTGGVGDKTTLIIAPIVAACGVKVAKMSGRGLGHTGGTVDKLDAIRGFKTVLPLERFLEITNKIGLCVIGQSGNLAPADKKLYALRDVTATVSCLPLIVSSVMSKKLALGSTKIVLDVKSGSGSFCKTYKEAHALAKELVSVGKGAGKRVSAIITDMDTPLGNAIGNSLEVIEAVETLKGHGPEDLKEICLDLSAEMLYLNDKGTREACFTMAKTALTNGAAYQKFIEMVKEQGGDVDIIEDISKFPRAAHSYPVTAKNSGYISAMDAEALGISSLMLGAGRVKKEDSIDYGAGIILHKKTGDQITAGEKIATLYADNAAKLKEAEDKFLSALTLSDKPPKKQPIILGRVE